MDRIGIMTSKDHESSFFDCIAWNKNQNSEDCFTAGDVIVLTGEYKSGNTSKTISVSLQIQNIYIKGEKSDVLYPTYYPNYQASKKKGKCSSFKKKRTTANAKKSRYFVYVGNTEEVR